MQSDHELPVVIQVQGTEDKSGQGACKPDVHRPIDSVQTDTQAEESSAGDAQDESLNLGHEIELEKARATQCDVLLIKHLVKKKNN